MVLDANDTSARIGLQPERDQSGAVGPDRETGLDHRGRREMDGQEADARW